MVVNFQSQWWKPTYRKRSTGQVGRMWLNSAASWENLLMTYVNNKGADQPAHPCSLINAFVVRCLDCMIALVSISETSSLYLTSVSQIWDLIVSVPDHCLSFHFSRDVAQFQLVLNWCHPVNYNWSQGFIPFVLYVWLMTCTRSTRTSWVFNSFVIFTEILLYFINL